MPNLKKQDYLNDLKNAFEELNYTAKIDCQKRIGGNDIILTAQKGEEIIQIRMDRGAKAILGQYAISVYASNRDLVVEAEKINEGCKAKTACLNLEKKEF